MFLFCFAATDLRFASDISAACEPHFKEVSAKHRTYKTIPLPANKNNMFAPWAIHEKRRGEGERLLTLPDMPSPALSHDQRRLPPGATWEPTTAALPLSDGCGPEKMQVATICTPKSAQTWLWELKPAPRESQTSPGTRRDPGGLGSRAREETPIYFKMFSDDKTVTWPTAPATNLWMRNSSAWNFVRVSCGSEKKLRKSWWELGGGSRTRVAAQRKNLTWTLTPVQLSVGRQGDRVRWSEGAGGFWQHVTSSSMTIADPSLPPSSKLSPLSRRGDSSFQHVHKGRAGLNGLNGSAAPDHGGSDQLNGPYCVAAVVTGGLAETAQAF